MFRIEQDNQSVQQRFTQQELNRLVVYRNAVLAGFYNEGFKDDNSASQSRRSNSSDVLTEGE